MCLSCAPFQSLVGEADLSCPTFGKLGLFFQCELRSGQDLCFITLSVHDQKPLAALVFALGSQVHHVMSPPFHKLAAAAACGRGGA